MYRKEAEAAAPKKVSSKGGVWGGSTPATIASQVGRGEGMGERVVHCRQYPSLRRHPLHGAVLVWRRVYRRSLVHGPDPLSLRQISL